MPKEQSRSLPISLSHFQLSKQDRSKEKDDDHRRDGQVPSPLAITTPFKSAAESSMLKTGISTKLWKRLRAGGRDSARPGTQEDSQNSAVSSSANSPEANEVLRPEHAAPSTTTTPLRSTPNASQRPLPSDKAFHTAINSSSIKTAEISRTATNDQAEDIAGSATDGSLWDRAYDSLKEEEKDKEPKIITMYEDLLSRVLIKAQSNTPLVPHEIEDIGKVTNQIPQHDVIARREKLIEITDLGLKHMKDKKVSVTLLGHKLPLQDMVANVARAVEWAEEYVKDAVKDLPYASIIVAGVSLVLPLLKNPTADEVTNQEGFTYVNSQMRYYVAMESLLLPEDIEADLKADLAERLVDLYKLIIHFQVWSIIRFYRSRTENFFKGAIRYDSWDKKLQDIKEVNTALFLTFETVMSGRSLQALRELARQAEASYRALDSLVFKVQEHVEVSREQLAVWQNIDQHITDHENQACLQDLRATDPRDDKARIEQTKGGLLQDSYSWVLNNTEFQKWRHDDHSRLLWIKGDPGKGKTMLLCGIIEELQNSISNAKLVSFFFCQATDSRINSATAVLRGLIYLLVNQQASLISHIRKKYVHAGNQLFKDVNAWVALSEILNNMLEDPNLQSTYLIVDALDECDIDLPKLMDFIVRNSMKSHVKWVVSSRNKPEIEQKLSLDRSWARLSLELGENAEQVSLAVDAYIERRVFELPNIHDKDLQAEVRDAMRRKAKGTFLWVSLVIEELKKAESWEVEQIIGEMPSGLEEIYNRMFQQIQQLKRRNSELCKLVLSTATAAYRPLRLEELGVLSGLPKKISDKPQSIAKIVSLCGSFLTIREQGVYIIHQSAKDFLSNKAFNSFFPCEIRQVHHNMFSLSLNALSQTLRRDIYMLKHPGFPIDRVKQPKPDPLANVRYSCVYWVDHLHDCDPTKNAIDDLRNDGSVNKFLHRSFLYWLEALSLLRSMSEGILLMRKLDNLLRGQATQLANLIRDGCRFIQYHKWAIENSPLQVYASALVFSPASTIMRSLFQKEEPEWIITKPIVEDDWNTCLQTLEGHTSSVCSVVFSHDSKLLASGLGDTTIKIWDTATGSLQQTLKGHSDLVRSVVFSHDSKLLASGSNDITIKIWDTATGSLQQTLKGHSNLVRSVVFSHDSKLLASGSNDKTIKIWDTATGSLQQTLKGHSDSVWSVVFSHDSKLLASGSNNKTIKIWDTATGSLQQTLKGHSDSVWSVVFSHDSKLLASGSYDKTIKIWDTATGSLQQTLKGHSDSVWSVVFSHDSKLLVSGSDDTTIKIWDTATGSLQQTLKGHSDSVQSVVFSHDSKLLVSGSDDTTIKIWDTATGSLQQTLKGHSDSVRSVVFSHDSKLLVSGSDDTTIKIWDTATGSLQQTLKGHSDSVRSVVFSHDSKLLVSGSNDTTIKIWDTATGSLQQTLKGYSDWVRSVVFSHDSKLLVSGSDDTTIKIWDIATGSLQQTLKGHSDSVRSVVFSHDSKLLVSGSDDTTIKIWDTATGSLQQTLKGYSDSVRSVVFSHDSKLLVSGSNDTTIKIWDTATGSLQQTLKGYSDWVRSVVFSHDSKLLVSGSDDTTIKIWDTATGSLQQTLKGHSDSVRSVVFSHDSKLLGSGSDDKTIKIWDTATGSLQQTLKGHSDWVWSVVFSHDSKLLGSGSNDKTIKIWDTATGSLQQTITINAYISKLSFDITDSILITNIGNIEINRTQLLSFSKSSWKGSSKSDHKELGINGSWIIWNAQNLLWLPPDYRAVHFDISLSGSTVAIGCPSGKVFIIKFSLPILYKILDSY